MKQMWKELIAAVLTGVLLPWLLVSIVHMRSFSAQKHTQSEPSATSVETLSQRVFVNVFLDEQIVQMPLEEYVAGVLLCELPEDFSMEAKKAQAVVARTYALRTCFYVGKHPENSVCTDPSCCQGYTDPIKYQGTSQGVSEAQIAAEETAGEVLLYNGMLIEATYFSCSGGRTEDAIAVWGSDIPYLCSVESPGEEAAAHYTDTVVFSVSEFQKALGLSEQIPTASLIGEVVYTEGGGVETIQIGGHSFTGTQLRSMLKLRSTAFAASISGSNVVITTKGFGHRVGMSQYGAEAMAKDGKTYQQIVSYYYQGVVLSDYKE